MNVQSGCPLNTRYKAVLHSAQHIHYGIAHPRAENGGDGLQIWRKAARSLKNLYYNNPESFEILNRLLDWDGFFRMKINVIG
jgi:hypothetical protein